MENNNRLNAKDLINVGIYTAICAVICCAIAMTGVIPIMILILNVLMGALMCPLADYAKKYVYEDLMPHMCALDHSYAKIMHAKLIRTHTVATGADSCDYWYVPDESNTAKNYTGHLV